MIISAGTVVRGMLGSLAVALLLAMSACGLKGPLYQPDDSQEAVAPTGSARNPQKRRTPPIPAPQSQKKDRETREEASPAPPADAGSSNAPAPRDPDRPASPTPVPAPGN